MAAPRGLIAVAAVVLVACANPPPPAASPTTAPTAEPTPTALPLPSGTPASSPVVSPPPAVDPATALRIAAPYELETPSTSDLEQLSGNIRGLPSDLAEGAGPGYAPSDFPMGVRFVRDADRSVGAIVVLGMPAEVAEMPGLLESVATAVAGEVNAVLSYETIQGVKVGVVRGPIANTIAIVHGNLVMAQSGQPSVDPKDLMTAVIAAS